MEYDIRPHHCFTKWVLVWRNGVSLRAFTSKSEAEAFIRRQRTLEDFKKREVRL